MQSTYPAGGGDVYFAAPEEKDVAGKILQKVSAYGEISELTGSIRQRLATAYRYYYGFDSEGSHVTSAIHRSGEQGELAKYRVNHARRHVNTLLNLVISQRVVWQPKATNIDYDSVRQCEIAAAVLEYYWHDRQVEKHVARAVEESIAFTEGFVMGGWDDFLGEDAMPNPDAMADGVAPPPPQQEPDTSLGPDGKPPEADAPAIEDTDFLMPDVLAEEPPPANTAPKYIKSGDIFFENVCTWNVIRDPNKQSWEMLDWVIVRTWRNKYDLAARFPSVAKHVLSCPAQYRDDAGTLAAQPVDNDDIEVYYFFHKRTPAVPEGREVVLLANKTVLRNRELVYDEIPLFRVCPSNVIGTPFGYSPFMEILGLQELIDSLHSGIATNQTTFTVQNIVLTHGSEIDPELIDGGLRAIFIPPDGKPPQALQLCATPPETFKHVADLKNDQEMLMGLNPVASGQSESQQSGVSMALQDAQAKQQSSGLHGSQRRLIQDLGNFVVQTLRRNAWAPRKIALVGNDFSALLSEEAYDGESFNLINRVQIDTGNPLAQTAAGRVEMAQQLLQMGLVQTPEQYYQVLQTGRLEPVTRGLTNELLLIRSENEDISKGNEAPVAMLHDNHLLHGREHRIPVSSPQARRNPNVLRAHMEHMHQHYEQYYGAPPMQPAVDPLTGQPLLDPMTGQPAMQMDPMYRERMMMLCGLAPPAPPMLPGAPGGAPSPDGSAPPGTPGPAPEPPGSQPGGVENAKLPGFPTNPSTGREWDPKTAGGAVNNT